jgi:hypothetical protein
MAVANEPEGTKRSGSPSRRSPKVPKYYEVNPDYRLSRPVGLELENEELIRRRDKAWFTNGLDHPGFWPMPEPPRLRYVPEDGRMPRDLENYHGFWLISDRAKSVLESVDPAAFAFVNCEILLPDGLPGPLYWFCDVLPIIDALDEAASDVEVYYEPDGRKVTSMLGARRVIFKSELVGSAHIFRMAYFRPQVICDEVFRIACKTAGLKGFSFVDRIVSAAQS